MLKERQRERESDESLRFVELAFHRFFHNCLLSHAYLHLCSTWSISRCHPQSPHTLTFTHSCRWFVSSLTLALSLTYALALVLTFLLTMPTSIWNWLTLLGLAWRLVCRAWLWVAVAAARPTINYTCAHTRISSVCVFVHTHTICMYVVCVLYTILYQRLHGLNFC